MGAVPVGDENENGNPNLSRISNPVKDSSSANLNPNPNPNVNLNPNSTPISVKNSGQPSLLSQPPLPHGPPRSAPYIPIFLDREGFEHRLQSWWIERKIQPLFTSFRLPHEPAYPHLHDLYTEVVRLGGFRIVSEFNLWPDVLNSLLKRLGFLPGAPAGSRFPAARFKLDANTVRLYSNTYESLLHSFEEHTAAYTRHMDAQRLCYHVQPMPTVTKFPEMPATAVSEERPVIEMRGTVHLHPLYLPKHLSPNPAPACGPLQPMLPPPPARISPLVRFAHVCAESLRAMGLPEPVVGLVEMNRSALQRQCLRRRLWEARRHQYEQRLADRELLLRMPGDGSPVSGTSVAADGQSRSNFDPGYLAIPGRARRRVEKIGPDASPRYGVACRTVTHIITECQKARFADPLPVLHLDRSEMVQILHCFKYFGKLAFDIRNILPMYLYLSNNSFLTRKLAEIVVDLTRQFRLIYSESISMPLFILNTSYLRMVYYLSMQLMDRFKKLVQCHEDPQHSSAPDMSLPSLVKVDIIDF